jgi:AcrR family transcriptional regulator
MFTDAMPRVVPEYKEEAKNRILHAASRVFAEKGYRQATMEDVAKKIDVSKGALYLYFSSKEELFEAICSMEPVEFKQILYSTFDWNKDPLTSASEFFDKMMKRYGSALGLFFDIFLEASRNPAIRRALAKTHNSYVEILTSFLKQIQEKGYISSQLDLHSLANAVIAMWNGTETLVVSGLPVAEAKEAWLEGFKAMFLQEPLETNLKRRNGSP